MPCRTPAGLASLAPALDLADAFGPYPPAVGALLELAEIRVLARRWGIHSIIIEEPDIVFRVEDLARANAAFTGAPGTVRMADTKTIYLRPPSASYLELMKNLSDAENQIQYARRYYNGAVNNLNTRIATFPDLVPARLFGFVQAEYFEFEPVRAG